MSCNLDNASYENRANNSKKITLLTSHVPFLQGGGPYCLTIPTEDDSKDIILDRCSNATNVWLKKTDGVTNISDKPYQDNLFFYDRNSLQIKSVRDRDGCIYAADNGTIKYKKNCNDVSNFQKKFKIDTNFHQIESISEPGKCITATGFMDELNRINNSGNKSNFVSQKQIKLAECANKTYNTLTAYDPLADGMFVYDDPMDVTSNLYKSLSEQYKTLLKLTEEQIKNIIAEYEAESKRLKQELNYQIGVNEVSHQTIDELQTKIMNNHKQSFELINAQTDAIKKKIKNMQSVNNTDQKKNLYQLEQNKIIKTVHTILFWTYFVFVFIFLLIAGFAVGPMTVTFVSFLVLSVIYPFAIIYIEYAVVFLYYFIEALIVNQPMKTLPLKPHLLVN